MNNNHDERYPTHSPPWPNTNNVKEMINRYRSDTTTANQLMINVHVHYSSKSVPEIACAKIRAQACSAADLLGRGWRVLGASGAGSPSGTRSTFSFSGAGSDGETTSSRYRCCMGLSSTDMHPFLLIWMVAALVCPSTPVISRSILPRLQQLRGWSSV